MIGSPYLSCSTKIYGGIGGEDITAFNINNVKININISAKGTNQLIG
jgi:hypothetical protein